MQSEERPIDRERRDKQKIARVESTKEYRSGRVSWHQSGKIIGWWRYFPHGKLKRLPIYLAGAIQVGTSRRLCGVCTKKRWIFLGEGGRLWMASTTGSGRRLAAPAASPHGLSEGGKRQWADNIIAMMEDALVPRIEATAAHATARRYQRQVEILVAGRVEEAKSLHVVRSASMFALGACEHWRHWHLTKPRHPTLHHSLLVSLVLVLDDDMAAELIQLGSLCEFRVPIISRSAAMTIYQEAKRLLATCSPAWYAQGWLTDWKHIGSIDRMFRTEYIRLLSRSAQIDVDLGTAAGLMYEIPRGSNQETNEED